VPGVVEAVFLKEAMWFLYEEELPKLEDFQNGEFRSEIVSVLATFDL